MHFKRSLSIVAVIFFLLPLAVSARTFSAWVDIFPPDQDVELQFYDEFYEPLGDAHLTGFSFSGTLDSGSSAGLECTLPAGQGWYDPWAAGNETAGDVFFDGEWEPTNLFLPAGSTCTFYANNGADPNAYRVFMNYSYEDERVASSSVVSVYNGFSYGEVLQVVFLFLIFGVVAYSFLFHWLRGYRVKN